MAKSGQDKKWTELLWEAGCTVTIQVRTCGSPGEIAIARNMSSEKLKAIRDSSLSDTFITFTKMCTLLNISSTTEADVHNLRFNGSSYNASMHKAVTAVASLMGTAGDGPFIEALLRLEFAFGRDVLSNAYSKLHSLVRLAKNFSNDAQPPEQVAAWLVDMLHLAFLLKIVAPKNATESFLDKDRKTGNSGFWPACLVLLEVGRNFPHLSFHGWMFK